MQPWRSAKYEKLPQRGQDTPAKLEADLLAWFGRYNTRRPHLRRETTAKHANRGLQRPMRRTQ
jgi:hypothetical protein